ncbi:precorrin-2 dehydrogenase/sirohydrochlorin ferrochelatase family protein [Desulforudis sp. 1088]|uniref:precorrin-2 dehydrogenase/sirohydrochlorin ferrochelatase family protein n=2 Tax=Candidatus Desulforudis TaxID=471826 RepID=UPI003CE56B08
MAVLYPVMIRLEGQLCLVVGGGRVAERKVRSLLAAGARVNIVSPELTPSLQDIVDQGLAGYLPRRYRDGDVRGHFLVISATNDPGTNGKVARECARERVLINAVDDPANCNFYVPATVRRGDLVLAVSTAGKSPLLARKIREELESLYGDVYAQFLDYLGAKRAEIIRESPDDETKAGLLESCLSDEVMSALRRGDLGRAKELVDSVACGSRS